jgi:hypothetical protein
MPLANYVLVIDLGDSAGTEQYTALNQLMCELGFTLRGSQALRPAQFSLTSALPLSWLRRVAEDRIKAQLQADVIVDAYEIKHLLQFSTTRLPGWRRFH